MAVIDAVAVNKTLDLFAQLIAGDISSSLELSYFKVGEGGFNESGGVKDPQSPLDNTDLERLKSDGTLLTGTVTFSNGSTAVTGSGTAFESEVVPGQYIRLDADLEWVLVSNVVDDENIVLSSSYSHTGGSGDSSVISVPYRVTRKAFASGDLTYSGPDSGETVATAFLDFGEGNDTGYEGGDPEYFEVGVFNADDYMIAYGTYPGIAKNNAVQFEKLVRLVFSRS